MATSQAEQKHRRVKLSVDVDAGFRRRLRIAAVESDMTLREFLISLVEERLAEPDTGREKGETA